MIKVENWDRYAETVQQTLTAISIVIQNTEDERIKEYMRIISHYLVRGVEYAIDTRVKSAFRKCRKLDEYNDFILLAYIDYCELFNWITFTEG